MARLLKILQVIHDFLPRHRAGSEIYALDLSRELGRRHDVAVLCADYDPRSAHGSIVRRAYRGLRVIELINNWSFATFEETYRSELINALLERVLRQERPDVVHVHNLLSLSMDLPAIAARRQIPVFATLHDYTLVCPAGGQRIHAAEEHICHQIDPARCSRCFQQSPLFRQLTLGQRPAMSALLPLLGRFRARWPNLAARFGRTLSNAAGREVTPADIERRLAYVERVVEPTSLFVSPSASLADEFVRLGFPRERLRVSACGLPGIHRPRRVRSGGPLVIGFVGTISWHKGLHALIEAASRLPGGSYELRVFGSLRTAPDYAAAVRQQARGLPVTFEGEFEESQASAIYPRLDLVVVPSLWPENSPLVIREAYLAGVPVIGARRGGIPELVRHEVNGLTYDTPQELAAALERVVNEPSLLDRWVTALPPVKSVEEDASWWEENYARATRAP